MVGTVNKPDPAEVALGATTSTEAGAINSEEDELALLQHLSVKAPEGTVLSPAQAAEQQKFGELVSTRSALRVVFSQKIDVITALLEGDISDATVSDEIDDALAELNVMSQEMDRLSNAIRPMAYSLKSKADFTAMVLREQQVKSTEAKINAKVARTFRRRQDTGILGATPPVVTHHNPVLPVSPQGPTSSARIPKFAGDPKLYREWYQLFELLVLKSGIPKIMKFLHLRESLTGQAGRAIAHLNFEPEQFDVAMEIVKSSFGGASLAAEDHMRTVRRLCSSRDIGSPAKFCDFVSAVSQNIKALLTLGNSYESLSLALAPIILECLPYQLREQFGTKYLESSTKGSANSKLEELLSFLDLTAKVKSSLGHVDRLGGFNGPRDYSMGKPRDPQKHFAARHAKSAHQSFAPRGPDPKKDFAFHASVANTNNECLFCNGRHPTFKCKKEMSVSDRRQIVERENVCFRCLLRNHSANKCRSKMGNCPICKGRHYAVLCTKSQQQIVAGSTNSNPPFSNAASSNHQGHASSASEANGARPCSTVLQTCFIKVSSGKSSLVCRALLDTGAQRSFISQQLVERLGLNPIGSESMISYTIGGSVSELKKHDLFEVTLQSRFTSSVSVQLRVLGIPLITKGSLPFISDPRGLQPVADDFKGSCSSSSELLIGADFSPQVQTGEQKVFHDLIATETIFGWVFNGKDGEEHLDSDVTLALCALRSTQPASTLAPMVAPESPPGEVSSGSPLDDIQFLWDIECTGMEDSSVADDAHSQELYQFFVDSVERLPCGRYVLSLPFKDNVRALGDTAGIAKSRLSGLLKSQGGNKRLLEAIDKEVLTYVAKGYAEVAEPKRHGELANYLPILAVVKGVHSDETAELMHIRVVKDAGERRKHGAALNDVLFQGPNLLPDMVKVLFHFRKYKVAIVSDIEKAFFQFKLNPAHRTFLRFFWPLGISTNPNAPIVELWGTVLDFGLICSPWLHCQGIRYHLNNEQSAHPEDAELIQEIISTFYMDDIITGADSLASGKTRVASLKRLFDSGCFPLKKWATNSPELAKFIKDFLADDSAVSCGNSTGKFLGVLWNQVSDSFGVFSEKARIFLLSNPASKRTLLKGLAQIFDPLGVLAPLTILPKMLLQKLWEAKLDWDVTLSGILLEEFNSFASGLQRDSPILVRRCIDDTSDQMISRRELHVFCDASLGAYGCVAYLRTMYRDGSNAVSFLMAKSRVTPLKGSWTIHRLELLGASLAAKVASRVSAFLSQPVDSTLFWCDNASVLGWVRDRAERWKPFVANRIKGIQSQSDSSSWHYVRSQDNPADLLSRGCLLSERDKLDFWLNGPRWLCQSGRSPDPHPLDATAQADSGAEQERKAVTVGALAADTVQSEPFIFDSNRISSWPRAVRIWAYVARFLRRCRRATHQSPHTKVVDSADFEAASVSLLHEIQRAHFATEFSTGCKDLHKSSRIARYNPFLDDSGLIRCKSRLWRSNELSYDEKYPVILPGNNGFVELLIQWVHYNKCCHSGGLAAVLHHLRSRYLVLNGRKTTKKLLRECKTCLKFRALPAAEQIPPISAFRLERSAPFTVTGVDFAGPIYTKDDTGARRKSYIALFVCAVTRAIHLELVADLSTFEFLMALRRFSNRRPGVSRFISDNALTFKRAAKDLALIIDHVKDKQIQELLSNQEITWEFITPRAPQHGGFYERLVQTVKRPLRKILGTNVPRFTELVTILTDIEAMVNSRPLSAVEVDVNEIKALSPADLLYGYLAKPPLAATGRSIISSADQGATILSKRWKAQQSVLNAFWKRFRQEYLEFLRSAHNQPQVNRNPLNVGDICILKDEAPSRAFWPICRILSLSGGLNTDLRRRSCLIKLGSGQILRRPIYLLYKLEVN